jgi:hypothetical protein
MRWNGASTTRQRRKLRGLHKAKARHFARHGKGITTAELRALRKRQRKAEVRIRSRYLGGSRKLERAWRAGRRTIAFAYRSHFQKAIEHAKAKIERTEKRHSRVERLKRLVRPVAALVARFTSKSKGGARG